MKEGGVNEQNWRLLITAWAITMAALIGSAIGYYAGRHDAPVVNEYSALTIRCEPGNGIRKYVLDAK